MLQDYIALADQQYLNTVDYDTKAKWLTRFEEKLRMELAQYYDAAVSGGLGAYPYDEIYVEYLKMKIAETAGDITRYNNYLTAFNSARDELYAYYARTYKSKQKVEWKNVL